MSINKKIWNLLFCLILSITIITICSKNSPIYCFNDWVDANAFFTMGKGWMNGLIPYRDLFEQKGPILYLIYGISSLISSTDFFGVYIMEILSFFLLNYYILKMLNIFIDKKNSYLINILFVSIIVSSCFFVQGGSAEEFCLPLIAYSFYSIINYFNNRNNNVKKTIFLNGLVAGIVSLIKFNFLGFWFIWMATIFFENVINKEYKKSIYNCLIFLIGMLTPVIIFVLYFLFNNSLNEFIESYITFNFSSYTTKLSFLQRIKNFIINFKTQFMQDKIIFHLIVFGFIGILFSKKIFQNIYLKIFTILSFLFLAIGIYIGGLPYNYYFLLNEFYILFGILIIFIIINEKYKNRLKYLLLALIVLIFSSYRISKSINVSSIKLKKDYYAQFVFDEIIKKEENHTLLNYDNLDGGFYTVSNILPSTKYFMRQNINYDRYPIIIDEQNKIIKQKKVKFVIIREYYGNIDYHNTIPYLNENYVLIMEHEQLYEGMNFKYFLYSRKE